MFDSSKVVVWGTSFAGEVLSFARSTLSNANGVGGHALSLAAEVLVSFRHCRIYHELTPASAEAWSCWCHWPMSLRRWPTRPMVLGIVRYYRPCFVGLRQANLQSFPSLYTHGRRTRRGWYHDGPRVEEGYVLLTGRP
jgi:hypothetical protein